MTGSPPRPIRRPFCSARSTGSMERPVVPTRTPAITAATGSFSTDGARRRRMTKLSIGPRAGLLAGVARTAILLGLTAALAGCYAVGPAAETRANDNYPNDVRQRHPIAIHEGERTLEVFVGANRAGLAPAQRADVLAFAHRWGREATGGIIIQVPEGTANAAAAAGVLREIQSILAAAGVPPHAMVARRYRPANPMQLATVRVVYPKMTAEAGPCGLWPHDIGPSLD